MTIVEACQVRSLPGPNYIPAHRITLAAISTDTIGYTTYDLVWIIIACIKIREKQQTCTTLIIFLCVLVKTNFHDPARIIKYLQRKTNATLGERNGLIGTNLTFSSRICRFISPTHSANCCKRHKKCHHLSPKEN